MHPKCSNQLYYTYLNSSRTTRAGTVCWRYAFVILKFLVADFSVTKAAIHTSAIGQAANESIITRDCGNSAQILMREKPKCQPMGQMSSRTLTMAGPSMKKPSLWSTEFRDRRQTPPATIGAACPQILSKDSFNTSRNQDSAPEDQFAANCPSL